MSSQAPARVPLRAGTTPRRLVGSDPLVLDRPEEAWYLTTGEVDLFVVPTDDLGHPGRRDYVASVGPGALLVGAPAVHADGRTWRLTAVGVDASAVPLDSTWVGELATNPVLEAGLHAWLTATGSAVDAPGTRHPLSPAESGHVLSLEAGEVLNAPRDLVWLVPDRTVLALGLQRQSDALPTPLGAAFSTSIHRPGRGVVRRSDEITTADLDAGLAWVQHATVGACAALAAGRSQEEADRRATTLEADEATRARAHAALQRIGHKEAWVAGPADDPVLAACRLLGSQTDLTIQRPPEWARGLSPDPVRAIARASGVRVRAVTLDDGWWRHGADPLIAFREPDGSPVVLVPRPSGGFSVLDPVTAGATTLTDQAAAGLRPTGYVFYRPLPPGPITIGGLLRFGLAGSGRDTAKMLAYSVLVGLLSLAIPVAAGTILGNLVPVGQTGPVLGIAFCC